MACDPVELARRIAAAGSLSRTRMLRWLAGFLPARRAPHAGDILSPAALHAMASMPSQPRIIAGRITARLGFASPSAGDGTYTYPSRTPAWF